MSSVLAYNSKSILATSDSFPLIMSHIQMGLFWTELIILKTVQKCFLFPGVYSFKLAVFIIIRSLKHQMQTGSIFHLWTLCFKLKMARYLFCGGVRRVDRRCQYHRVINNREPTINNAAGTIFVCHGEVPSGAEKMTHTLAGDAAPFYDRAGD